MITAEIGIHDIDIEPQTICIHWTYLEGISGLLLITLRSDRAIMGRYERVPETSDH